MQIASGRRYHGISLFVSFNWDEVAWSFWQELASCRFEVKASGEEEKVKNAGNMDVYLALSFTTI